MDPTIKPNGLAKKCQISNLKNQGPLHAKGRRCATLNMSNLIHGPTLSNPNGAMPKQTVRQRSRSAFLGLHYEPPQPGRKGSDPELMREALEHNGLALRYASVALRADRTTVLIAVEQNGLALDRTLPSTGAGSEVRMQCYAPKSRKIIFHM